MQKDFHYYCVFVLANLANYSQEDAKTIAYSSQYVDDSTDSDQIRIKDYKFDTVRTAHSGIKSFKWDVHKKIYFPFHFIPDHPLNDRPFSYITKADSSFAQKLVDEAFADNTDLRLYRIGIALHTYADTWSHQCFSGRKHKENNVEVLCRFKNQDWIKCKRLVDIILDLFRAKVGHLQAFNFPDYSYLQWQYKNKRTDDQPYDRKNYQEFLKAAQAIFTKLSLSNKVKNVDHIWSQNEEKLRKLLEYNPSSKRDKLEAQCEKWRSEYSRFFESDDQRDKYIYQENEWRGKAMQAADAEKLYEFLHTDWVQFQRAALKQRYFVLERMM